MVQATFRFYGELNDFLPPAQRGRPMAWAGPDQSAVKHPIESIGVPHPEVEAIYIDGRPVGFDCRLQDGDMVEVFPLSADGQAPPLPLRPPPPQPIRFVLDTHLGGLASYLRLLGFDTLYRNDYADPMLAAITAEQGRVLLTRDRGLLKRKIVVYGYCVRETEPRQQVVSVLRRWQLAQAAQPWQRCVRCNGLLERVEKTTILERLEPKTKLYYDEFQRCTVCGQIFWQGSHYDRLVELTRSILAAASTNGA